MGSFCAKGTIIFPHFPLFDNNNSYTRLFSAGQSWDTWWANTPKTILYIREIQGREVSWIKCYISTSAPLTRTWLNVTYVFYTYIYINRDTLIPYLGELSFWKHTIWFDSVCTVLDNIFRGAFVERRKRRSRGEIVRGVERVSRGSRVRSRRCSHHRRFCHSHDHLRPLGKCVFILYTRDI